MSTFSWSSFEALATRILRRLGRALALSHGNGPAPLNWGQLRTAQPLCNHFGYSRGLPIDRVYIERFLHEHRGDVQGVVLEIGDNAYTTRFGGARVARSEVLDVNAKNPRATLIVDLESAPQLAGEQFDAIILTQTLQLVFNVQGALRILLQLLKPGGVLLVTVCGVSSVGRNVEESSRWSWSFTSYSLRRLLEAEFGHVTVSPYGNLLTSIAFLHGLAAGDLTDSEFSAVDDAYPVVIAARAERPAQRA